MNQVLKDVGENCIKCNCDTAWGSGNFINRIPAEDDNSTGYMCVDCQSVECDYCNDFTVDFEVTENAEVICFECQRKANSVNGIKKKISIERIESIAKDIISDVEWVQDSHDQSEWKGVKSGLERLISHLKEVL